MVSPYLGNRGGLAKPTLFTGNAEVFALVDYFGKTGGMTLPASAEKEAMQWENSEGLGIATLAEGCRVVPGA